MGNLGVIGGVSSEDIIDGLPKGEGVDLGYESGFTRDQNADAQRDIHSKSEVYTTPSDILALVMHNMHFREEGTAPTEAEELRVAVNLMEGAFVAEISRFGDLVAGTKNYLDGVVRANILNKDSVEGTMKSVRAKYEHVLDGDDENGVNARELVDTTEDFLVGSKEAQGDLSLKVLRDRMASFAYAVETVIYRATGMAL